MAAQLYVVCARDAVQADAWRREHELPQRQVIYAGSLGRVLGLRNFEVVYLHGFWDRPDAARIAASLRRDALKTAAGRGLAGS